MRSVRCTLHLLYTSQTLTRWAGSKSHLIELYLFSPVNYSVDCSGQNSNSIQRIMANSSALEDMVSASRSVFLSGILIDDPREV